jgi:uncharacterized membrane protein YedE/YeeE
MSVTTLSPFPARPLGAALGGINRGPVLAALAALGLGAWWLDAAASPRQATLYLLGAALGLVLYHASFGFTAAWRAFVADRRGAGLRAQMAMLALAVLLFFPALSAGSLFGQPVTGLVAPVGIGVAFGAFIFGIGMQLGGGCASGTLFAVGGGSTRMVVTLLAFIAGSTLGAAHFHWWAALPHLPATSMVKSLGVLPAIVLNLAVFAAIAGGTVWLERRRHGRLLPVAASPHRGVARLLRGSWPLLAGALGLAVLNFATLALAGRPWGITSAFALWGSQINVALGGDAASWPFWSAPRAAANLAAPAWTDVTTVMDIGIMAGALLAAGLAGKFRPELRVPFRSLAAAVIGGLLMGYGARQAYGCNIGAYFSGIASGSLHAWLWLPMAFAGSWLGTRLRPAFGLAVERTPAGSC